MTTDTALHPAAAKAARAGAPRRVLFVCTGNTCRSPMAAALYNDQYKETEGAALATSAGLYATPGAPISNEAVEALREAGIAPIAGYDYTAHRARPIRREMMEEADEVVAISGSHAMELTLRFPEFAGKIRTLPMDISDPYGQGIEAYRLCLMQLRYCLQLYGANGGEE